jgi:dienelactone hydrolase
MELVKQWYAKRIDAWEYDLATRSTDRVVRPFDWGAEWMAGWPIHSNAADTENKLRELNRLAIARSPEFFAYDPPRDFRLDGSVVRFTSAVESPYTENNTVEARYFPAKPRWKRGAKAVVVLPHWNSHAAQHVALCRGIAELGISALRISLPYHDRRMPPELTRADYAVSANVARTIDATRQSVIDVRSCYDWLQQRGYEDLGIVGTSLGSCYGFLTSAHDDRVRVNIFNHCSPHFADVVWTGLSTKHIREGIEAGRPPIAASNDVETPQVPPRLANPLPASSLEDRIDIDRLRAVWDCLSPVHHIDRFAAMNKRSLFLYATYDTTFPPDLSKNIVDRIARSGADHKVVVMPCGHYTLGESPFKFVAGYQICSFLKRNL